MNKDIIIADSKAIEHVVAIYSMYENKKINTNDIFDYCSQVIFKQFKGITNFFIYQDKSKTFTESYLDKLNWILNSISLKGIVG